MTALANDHSNAFLKMKKDPTLKRVGGDLSVLINDAKIANDGTVMMDLIPTDPGNRQSFESPSLLERFRVKRSGTKVEVKFLDIGYEEKR